MGRRTSADQNDPSTGVGSEPAAAEVPLPAGSALPTPSACFGQVFVRTLSHFFPEWRSWLGRIRDARNPLRIVDPLPFEINSAVWLLLMKLGARRQLGFAMNSPAMLANLNRLSGTRMRRVEHSDTLLYLLKRVMVVDLRDLLFSMIQRILRMKALDRFRFQDSVLTAIDATGHLSFNQRHCPHCLTQAQGDRTAFYHMVLEAKWVTSNGMALSLASEFIENADPQASRQDCELKAFPRLAAELKSRFPRLPIALLLDGLYLCQPVLDICRQAGWHYIITFKEGRMPERWVEYQALRRLQSSNRRSLDLPDGVHQQLAWVNNLPVGSHQVHVLECVETRPGKEPVTFLWATDFPLDASTVASVANDAGRLRWKIENQGFNEQKNGGFNLQHAYAWNWQAAQNFYLLLQIAQLIEQLVIHGSLLKASAGKLLPKIIGGCRKFGAYLAESLRVWEIPLHAFDPAAPARIQIRLDTG